MNEYSSHISGNSVYQGRQTFMHFGTAANTYTWHLLCRSIFLLCANSTIKRWSMQQPAELFFNGAMFVCLVSTINVQFGSFICSQFIIMQMRPYILPATNAGGNALSHVCLGMRLSSSNSNFSKLWPRNFISGTSTEHLHQHHISRSTGQGQGDRRKISHMSITEYTHLQVVCLWLKGKSCVTHFTNCLSTNYIQIFFEGGETRSIVWHWGEFWSYICTRFSQQFRPWQKPTKSVSVGLY